MNNLVLQKTMLHKEKRFKKIQNSSSWQCFKGDRKVTDNFKTNLLKNNC